jgi:hypothetical protein
MAKFSDDVTQGVEKSAARAMLRAVGLNDDDFNKFRVGIVSAGNEVTPCNLTGPELSKFAKEGVNGIDSAIVEKINPAESIPFTPSFANFDNSGPVRLQGVTSLPAETIPTRNLLKSSSFKPTALSIALAADFSTPCVTSSENFAID